jgi:hypothetical protein
MIAFRKLTTKSAGKLSRVGFRKSFCAGTHRYLALPWPPFLEAAPCTTGAMVYGTPFLVVLRSC